MSLLFQSITGDYPNLLAAAEPERGGFPSRRGLLLGLVLACLVFRLAMALWLPAINPDGVLYFESAQALEKGAFREAFNGFGLNVYPTILMLLHRCGLDWELAARTWGVAASTLVVLPLFGWLRRHFDDRVATAACFLYILHPKFIELSPAVIRDSTFWLLFMLSLYSLWRAVIEVRIGIFLAAGVATTLACLTRFEGLFLFVPLSLWSAWRFRGLRRGRARLAAGALLAVVTLPLLVLALNLVWPHARGEWLLPRMDPVARVQAWLQASGTSAPTHTGAGRPMSAGQMLWVYFPLLTRGLSPCFALLMLGGLWKFRGLWMRRDHQVLFYTALLVLLSSWIQLWHDQRACFRYVLPIVLMASPFAALALIQLTAWVAALPDRLAAGSRLKPLAGSSAIAFIALVHLVSVLLAARQLQPQRELALDLGAWLRANCPVSSKLVGPEGLTPVASYYAGGRSYQTYRLDTGDEATVTALVERCQPDFVLLHITKRMNAERCMALSDRLRSFQFEAIEPPLPFETCDNMVLFLRRRSPASRTVERRSEQQIR